MAEFKFHRRAHSSGSYYILYGIEQGSVELGKNGTAFRITTGSDTPDIIQPKICITTKQLEIFPHITSDNQEYLRVYLNAEHVESLRPLFHSEEFLDESLPVYLSSIIRSALSSNLRQEYDEAYDGRTEEYLLWFIKKVFNHTFPGLKDAGYMDRNRAIPVSSEPFDELYEAYVNFLDSSEFPTYELFQQEFPEETILSLSRGNLLFKHNTAILNGKRMPANSEEIKTYALRHLSCADYILYKQFRDGKDLNLPI